MQIRVLGCSGGIGKGLHTTSFLIDGDILIDVGTGVGDLTFEEMRGIRHVFMTHSHMDHIACLPLLIDTLFTTLKDPLILHAQPATLEALKEHVFNWKIWPDFSELPSLKDPVVRFETHNPGARIAVGERIFEMIEVNHIVPGVAYRVESGGKSFVFSGDTTTNDSLWDALNKHDNLDLLFIETAFSNREHKLAAMAKHYCPDTLATDLRKLKHRPNIGISHLKPGFEKEIMKEINALLPGWDLVRLNGGDIFTI